MWIESSAESACRRHNDGAAISGNRDCGAKGARAHRETVENISCYISGRGGWNQSACSGSWRLIFPTNHDRQKVYRLKASTCIVSTCCDNALPNFRRIPLVLVGMHVERRLTRQERDIGIGIETLAVFVRFWLATTPALPEPAAQAARAKAAERYEAFVAALGRRLAKGPKLRQEISEDIDPIDGEKMPPPAGV